MIEFPLVVKADVQGSVEAIVSALHAISNDEIKVRILHSGVGAITESDVTLASARGAPIIGFGVRPNAKARELIERNKTRMKYYDVIYDLTDDIRAEMAGELGPEKIEHCRRPRAGQEVFPAGKKDKAAGLLVVEGFITQGPLRPPHPRRRHRFGRPRSPRCGASRTMSTKSAPASNAAWFWPTPTTSSRTTCSKCSRSRNANGCCDLSR